MVVAKRVKPTKETKEAKIQKLIAKGSQANGHVDIEAKLDLVPVLIRFDRELLKRLDRSAKDHGQNRSAFVVMAAAEKLRRIERGEE